MTSGGHLPSESEWEFVARSGGQDIPFPWGNDTLTCTFADYGNCEYGLSPVCSHTPGNSQQGLCDLLGNVAEWVMDISSS